MKHSLYDPNNIFAKIIRGEIPCKKLDECPYTLTFFDINPQAPVHILLIPKIHISTLNDLTPKNIDIAGNLIYNAAKLANMEDIAHNGYRTVFNCNKWGGQTVYHLHLHLLGDRKFK